MTLNIKICNINRNICKFLIVFIRVDVEFNCRSRFYTICKDHVQTCRAKCGVVYIVYDRVQLLETQCFYIMFDSKCRVMSDSKLGIDYSDLSLDTNVKEK